MVNGRPHKVRLYSVTSSRDGEDGEGKILAFCIKKILKKIAKEWLKYVLIFLVKFVILR